MIHWSSTPENSNTLPRYRKPSTDNNTESFHVLYDKPTAEINEPCSTSAADFLSLNRASTHKILDNRIVSTLISYGKMPVGVYFPINTLYGQGPRRRWQREWKTLNENKLQSKMLVDIFGWYNDESEQSLSFIQKSSLCFSWVSKDTPANQTPSVGPSGDGSLWCSGFWPPLMLRTWNYWARSAGFQRIPTTKACQIHTDSV